MNDKKHIGNLFQKFIDNDISEDEYKILMEFIKKSSSQIEVKKMIIANWDRMDKSKLVYKRRIKADSNILFDKIIKKIENENPIISKKIKPTIIRRISRSRIYKVAATIIIVFGLYYLFQLDFLGKQSSQISDKIIDPNAITLKLNNGDIKIISKDNQQNIIDTDGKIIGIQNGTELNYTKNKTIKKLVYNEITVPYGKHLDLVLSDGTQIKLNSGTKIKYPVQFIKGMERKIYLRGEAYFDVAKDKLHPFIANVNDINVSVLGTQFNLSFYPEDNNINTVLVEGSVFLYEEGEENNRNAKTFLTPGYKASWNVKQRKMKVDKVDTDIYTAWKDGILLFKNMSFGAIKKKLERHFDISIENQNKFLEMQVYTASFKGETIEDILDSFNEDVPFEYSIENKKIIIKNPKTSLPMN